MAWVNGKSGTYNISTNNAPISGYVRWEEKYDVTANKSLITQTAYLRRTNIYSGATFFTNEAITRSFFFGSETVSTSANASLSIPGNTSAGGGTYVQVYTASKEIAHNSDGSKSITLGFQMTKNDAVAVIANSFTVPKTTATVTLTAIPRATTPTLSAATVTMENTINITLSPADSTFKHKIRYEFGSLVSQIKGVKLNGAQITDDFLPGGTYTFTPPGTLGGQIPNDNSGTAKLIVYTYKSDGTHIGTKTVNITINVPDYTPIIGGILLTGNNLLNGVYVAGKSTVTVTTAATPDYGSTIKSWTVLLDGKTYTTNKFTSSVLSAGYQAAVVTVTDSRGETAVLTSEKIAVQAYSVPIITSFTIERQSDGTTVIATVKGSISPVSNQNAKTVTVTLNGVTKTITSSSYTINGTATFTGVPTDSTLTGTAKLQDSYTSVTKDAVLPTVAVTMDFHHSGEGVAFGKVAENEGFLDVDWNLYCRKNASINNSSFAPFAINRMGSANGAAIKFVNSNGTLGFIGMANTPDSGLHRWNAASSASYLMLDVNNTKDYVIERGTSDGWEYTKWNSGKMELFGEKSLSFPEGAKQGDFPLYRSIVSLNLSGLLTKIMSGTCCIQTNGMVPQVCRHSSNLSTAEIVIVTSRTFSAFTITAPVYIIGKWK